MTNRILEPNGDPHWCPVTDGPYNVTRWGERWTVQNVLDPNHAQTRYSTQAEAQNVADRRNKAFLKRHPRRKAAS